MWVGSHRVLGADRNCFGDDEGMIHGYDLGCILAWFLFIFASSWDRWGQRFFSSWYCHVVISTMQLARAYELKIVICGINLLPYKYTESLFS